MEPPPRAARRRLAALALTTAALAPRGAEGQVSQALDCDLRGLMYNRSAALVGARVEVWDALQLSAYCGLPRPAGLDGRPAQAAAAAAGAAAALAPAATVVYVDAGAGSDANPGTLVQPFATVGRAVAATRGAPRPAAVVLRGGAVHHLPATVELFPPDSGLAIVGFPGEDPVVSGGSPLDGGVLGSWQPTGTPGVFAAPLNASAAGLTPRDFNLLWVNGTRAVLARWPNGNPETAIYPAGYATAGGWLPPGGGFAPPTAIYIDSPSRAAADPFYPRFQLCGGPGTTVGQFDPPWSFWGCADSPYSAQYVLPTGLWWDPAAPPPRAGGWTNASLSRALVHAMHGQGWGNWVFGVAGVDHANSSLAFGRGGWQEARGDAAGGGFFIEGVLEELDAPGEWFHDWEGGVLYYAVNGTGAPPPPPGALVAARLPTLFALRGAPGAPVSNVTLAGLTLAHTSATHARPFTVMSGGDVSVFPGGAVELRGTVGARVDGCTLAQLGGNGVFVGGRNDGPSVARTEFAWVGASAVVALGDSDLVDATALAVPRGLSVEGCVMRETGLVVKQAGPVYLAKTANTTVAGCVAFSMPREAVNINDGLAGGHAVVDCVLFNCMRETSDGGCVNTWDRQPFLTPGGGGMLPRTTTIARNLIAANYNALWGVDHDDGSNAYAVTDNVILFSGFKTYQGFNKTATGNLYVYADVTAGPFGTGDADADARLPRDPTAAKAVRAGRRSFGPLGNAGWPYCACDNGVGSLPPPQQDTWAGNTCIASGPGGVYQFSNCDPASPHNGGIPVLGGNTLLVGSDGAFSFGCGSATWNLTAAQAAGVDVGSVAGPAPSDAQVVAMVAARVGAW